MAMDLIHNFLNFVAPPFTFFSLCFFLPPYYLLKLSLSLFRFIFIENVARKVVLITGASSGIGEHLAYEYGRRGACLALAARREDRLQEVAERARELGSPDVITIPADVSNIDECKRIVEQTVSHYGRLDHLVNNAGITSLCMFEDIPDITNFRTVMDTNFWGSVYTTKYAVPHLRNSKGKIVVMSSASWLPAPRMAIYNATKAAMRSFFETLRVELGSDVTISIVMPGFIESEMTQGKFLMKDGKMEVNEDMRDVQVSLIPVGRVSGCAKAIVNSACRGDKCLTQPSWFWVTYIWKVFCPDVLEWIYRLSYIQRPKAAHEEAPSKKILDLTGAKKILYPTSVQSPPDQLKTD